MIVLKPLPLPPEPDPTGTVVVAAYPVKLPVLVVRQRACLEGKKVRKSLLDLVAPNAGKVGPFRLAAILGVRGGLRETGSAEAPVPDLEGENSRHVLFLSTTKIKLNMFGTGS